MSDNANAQGKKKVGFWKSLAKLSLNMKFTLIGLIIIFIFICVELFN